MRRKLGSSCLFVLVSLVIGALNAQAWVESVEKLAAAQPDECYVGLGERVDPISENPFICPSSATPYTSQTYVWGLTQQGDSLWVGTGANVVCTTEGAFFSEVSPGGGGSSVCEFGDSPVNQNLPDQYGDWRPPKVYQYNLSTGQVIDRTPYNDPNINRTLGLRSAGSLNGVVFLAGGGFNNSLIMFAYNGSTGQYLGSHTFTQYRTIRKWIVVNGQLYTGVGTSYYGRILRWTGSLQNLWSFQEVGQVSGVVRELAEYIDGSGRSRIAVTAKGVFLSPAITGTGLTSADARRWTTIWTPEQYEPDYITRTTYTGGGIQFLNGWLYFGTMHVPGNAYDLHTTCTIDPYNIQIPPSRCMGEPRTSQERSALSAGTARATSVWRIRNAESSNRVTQLLYGEARLPAYNAQTRSFPLVDNLGGYVPLLGSSGFNNRYNNYTWVMEVVDNKLFIGTMDYSTQFDYDGYASGADLWRIDGTASDNPVPAVAETTNAFGKPDYPTYTYKPYGFRNLIKSPDGTRLYAGMATGVNVGGEGDGAGWQLLELDSGASPTAITESTEP